MNIHKHRSHSIRIERNTFFRTFFFFKYLDGDYIKRLHINVSKNVQQGIKDVQKTTKNDLSKEKTPQHNQQTTNEITNTENSKLDEKAVSIRPTEIVQEKVLHPSAFKLELKPARIHSSKENKYSEAKLSNEPLLMRKNVQPQMVEFDDDETILAKITSSQRAICASLDTLM